MRRILSALLILACPLVALAKDYHLASPSGDLSATISVNGGTLLSLSVKGTPVLQDCRISMTLADSTVLGNSNIRKDTRGSRTENINAPFYRQSAFQSSYNYLSLRYDGNYTLQLRAYDDGIAYRFVTSLPEDIEIIDESVEFNFTDAYPAIIPWRLDKADPYESSFENQYSTQLLGEIGDKKDKLAFFPIVVKVPDCGNILLTESDVEDYPGMFVKLNGNGFKGVFPPVPAEYKRSEKGVKRAVSYTNILAKTIGSRSFPWRIIAYAPQDKDLPVNNMVYQTASACRIDELDWISPGQSSWEWWNNRVLYNVPFKAGLNTDTYKYHIDFASNHGIEYVTIDEGWYKNLNPLNVNDAVDIKYLCGYAQESNVKLILWMTSSLLYENAEEICEYYSNLGVGGFKVDFFDAQDQVTIQQVYELAETCAKYRLVLDLHGFYKPTGLNRTFPNILNFEGVYGLENLKWANADQANMPLNDTYIPFIRMAAGPMDYTQGAMRNSTKAEFRPVNGRPMSQGTRAHQIALYIIYDSPLCMLCDSPSAYEEDQATLSYISSIPSVFSSTTVLDGEMGKYIVTLRERDGVYYVGGITNWEARSYQLDCSFLPAGEWRAKIYKDGANADITASDHVIEETLTNTQKTLEINMEAGGGFAVIIER